ncbi:hypothetical protein FRC02_009305 [Tulasnella sp. 418]|nr:hypothetical protein FRC02_009305 [Tulasnella sp. 418]
MQRRLQYSNRSSTEDAEHVAKSTPKRRRRENPDDSDDDYLERDSPSAPQANSERLKRRASTGLSAEAVSPDDAFDPEESPEAAENTGSDDAEDYGSKYTNTPKGKKAFKESKIRSSKQRIVSDDEDFHDDQSDGGEPHTRASPEKQKPRGGVMSIKGKVDKDKLDKKIFARDQRKTAPAGSSQTQSRIDPTRDEPPNKKKKVAPLQPKRISELSEASSTISSLLPSRAAQARGHTGSADYDLRDKDALQSLFQSAKKQATPKRDQHEKMRMEAKKARAEAAQKDTFDLMAGCETIKAFEFQLEARQAIHPPQILLAPLLRWEQTAGARSR